MNPAFADLSAACTVFGQIGADARRDAMRIVASWPAVPVEIIRAAGYEMVLAQGAATPTPVADAVLEPGVFPSRLRHLVEAALTGRLAHVAAIVMSRTSDADYKAFLYLREFARRGKTATMPPVLLFDLLQSGGPAVAEHDRARMQALIVQLGELGGTPVTPEALSLQIAQGNHARTSGRTLLGLRQAAPRITGSDALAGLGAFWQLGFRRYAELVDRAVTTAAVAPLRPGARVLLAGVPVDSPSLHAGLESLECVVVDELSPFGHDAVAGDVSEVGDPLAALARHYWTHALSARTPASRILQRFTGALDGIDAVVFCLPAEDPTFGWDYPRLRDHLGARGTPHVVLTSDPQQAVPAREAQSLRALFTRSARRLQVRHG